MASSGATPPSNSVSFPVTESPQKHARPISPLRGPHLPFRRISLPTAPSLQHRISVVSVASFDSLAEDGDGESPRSTRPLGRVSEKSGQSRPPSVDPTRRRKKTRVDAGSRRSDEKQISKRRKIVDEFYETEQAYVEGLELIYSHFLTPIITSLDTPEPLLNRSVLTSIFSNFIDIWNLHRSFLSSLTSLLEPIQSSSQSPAKVAPPPDLSPLLLAHFPYLSLYTPFVTAFPSTISALSDLITPPTSTRPSPQYNQRFATFLSDQESDPRCGKLKLRDWLLTIVQRCPRYLLLLKDLINSTSKDDPEHAQLTAVHALVSKITLSLNTSLHTHAQTMALLALQRATPNLPFQLISPGRTLLKRGPLFQVERSEAPAEREFLLFSDCMIWLAISETTGQSWDWSWSAHGSSGSSANVSQSTHNTPVSSKITGERPAMSRSRSKSEAELPTLKADALNKKPSQDANVTELLPSTPPRANRSKLHTPLNSPPPPPNMARRRYSVEDKWSYKGRIELVDIQVIVGSALEDTRKFEILSPEGSFILYANSETERDEWASEIRGAKSQLLVSLNVTNPNSTLTSSASTNHVRRALQALPYHPDDDRIGSIRISASLDAVNSAAQPHVHHHGRFRMSKKEKAKYDVAAERRRKVEHWVPAIWIPDGKANACMRCGRTFGWRRRRHHCRLCGRCVCAACSDRTFFIADSSAKQDSKPARACNACYESVFPVIKDTQEADTNDAQQETSEGRNGDTITSLSGLPSWLSMPALPVQRQPHALMAIDINSNNKDSSIDVENVGETAGASDDRERRPRLRVKSHQRLRSYKQIVEDFKEHAETSKQELLEAAKIDEPDDTIHDENEGDDDEDEEYHDNSEVWCTPTHSALSSPFSSPRKQRREDTARRSKRFSLPAVALHPTNVTARTSDIPEANTFSRESSTGDQSSNLGLSKRFSLVLAAGRNSHYTDGSSTRPPSTVDEGTEAAAVQRSVAAARLSELLGRKPKV